MVDRDDSIMDKFLPDKINLTEKEKHDLIKVLNEKWATVVVERLIRNGVEGFIEEWKEIAQGVEKGIYSMPEEFDNDLSSREILEDIMDVVNLKRKNKILEKIQPLDDIVKSKITFIDLEKEARDYDGHSKKTYLEHKLKWISEHPKDKYWWYWGKFNDLKFEV